MFAPKASALTGRRMALALAVLATQSCTAEAYRQAADDEVYGILDVRRSEVLGDDDGSAPFSIEKPDRPMRQQLIDSLNESGSKPELELSLKRALQVAAENSREFQTQKERLYRSALALTGQRNRYSTIFGAGSAATAAGVADESADGTIRSEGTASKILSSGARVLGSFVNSFFRVFTSGGGWNTSSLLRLSITQPLLAGFGRTVTMEPLTQAERNVVYAIRTYERFRRTFAVSILEDYMAILQQRNFLENQQQNFASLQLNRKRARALAQAGRLPKFQVDQAEQQEFSAQNRVINAQAQLQTLIDRFKITLGLPMDVELKLDDGVLNMLRELGVKQLGLTEEEAIATAFERRLDYQNAKGALVDAERQIGITANALQAGLDLSGAVSIPNEDPKKAFDFDWKNYEWSAGLAIDLPLNRVPERNVYRQALISLEVEIRNFEQLEDNIKAALRRELRDVQASWRSYRIQRTALDLAIDRVKSTSKLIEAGRASTRDYLESEQARLQSENSVTGALVDYVVSKLRLLRDLELLDVGTEGLELDFGGLDRWTIDGSGEAPLPEEPMPEGSGAPDKRPEDKK